MATAIASRTDSNGTTTTQEVRVPEGASALFSLDVSAIANTPTLDIALEYYNDAAAEWEGIFDSAGNAVTFSQATGVGEDSLHIGSGIHVEKLTGFDRHYNVPLPRVVRLSAVTGNAGGDTITYSVGVRFTY